PLKLRSGGSPNHRPRRVVPIRVDHRSDPRRRGSQAKREAMSHHVQLLRIPRDDLARALRPRVRVPNLHTIPDVQPPNPPRLLIRNTRTVKIHTQRWIPRLIHRPATQPKRRLRRQPLVRLRRDLNLSRIPPHPKRRRQHRQRRLRILRAVRPTVRPLHADVIHDRLIVIDRMQISRNLTTAVIQRETWHLIRQRMPVPVHKPKLVPGLHKHPHIGQLNLLNQLKPRIRRLIPQTVPVDRARRIPTVVNPDRDTVLAGQADKPLLSGLTIPRVQRPTRLSKRIPLVRNGQMPDGDIPETLITPDRDASSTAQTTHRRNRIRLEQHAGDRLPKNLVRLKIDNVDLVEDRVPLLPQREVEIHIPVPHEPRRPLPNRIPRRRVKLSLSVQRPRPDADVPVLPQIDKPRRCRRPKLKQTRRRAWISVHTREPPDRNLPRGIVVTRHPPPETARHHHRERPRRRPRGILPQLRSTHNRHRSMPGKPRRDSGRTRLILHRPIRHHVRAARTGELPHHHRIKRRSVQLQPPADTVRGHLNRTVPARHIPRLWPLRDLTE